MVLCPAAVAVVFTVNAVHVLHAADTVDAVHVLHAVHAYLHEAKGTDGALKYIIIQLLHNEP